MSLSNHGMLIGNVVKDPELRTTAKGSVLTLRLAVDNVQDTLYVDITFWDKKAEIIGTHVSKGRKLIVSYYLKSRCVEKNGVKFDIYELVGTDFEFGDKKNEKIGDKDND